MPELDQIRSRGAVRTAIFADIHANREAFDACLAHAARLAPDRCVFLGDIVGYGADPGYVVDRVQRLVEDGAVALLGNHDEGVVTQAGDFNARAAAAIEWTRRQLDAGQLAFLRGLPLTWQDGERLFVHATACGPDRWEYITGPVQAERSLARTTCRETFCGHTHRPALYHMTAGKPASAFRPGAKPIALTPGRRWLAVIGAVGQPRDGNPAACYALLTDAPDTLTYIRVPYDHDAAARKIVMAGLPEQLAARLSRGI